MNYHTILISLAILIFILLIIVSSYIFIKLNSNKCSPQVIYLQPNIKTNEIKTNEINRDIKVLKDPLYPPINRTNEIIHNTMQQKVNQGLYYQSLTDNMDSFRLVGYLTCEDSKKDVGNNNWKLFGRMKDRNVGEFYIIPTNNQIDLKIPLTNDVVVGEKLRDLYTLPKNMQFQSPMLNNTIYIFTELPKNDFGSRYN